jgi:hypothetical protein
MPRRRGPRTIRGDGVDLKACDICGLTATVKNPVLRFGLRRSLSWESGRKANHAAGSLDVCSDCWTKLAKPRMQPQKGRLRTPWPPEGAKRGRS